MFMNTEQNKDIARRFSEDIINKGDMMVADELIDMNYINYNPIPGQMPGLEGFKKSVSALQAAIAFQETIEALVAEGDTVAVRAVRQGTHTGPFMGVPATGKQVSVTAIYILRIVNGKIKEAWLNWDTLGLLQQIGAVQIPGQAGR